MITVHHLERSRSHRILWLLEELKVPYEFKIYKRDPVTLLAPPELKKIHPLGKSPTVTDGNQVVAESAVILESILDQYGNGRLRPHPGTPDSSHYRYFMHYTEGSLMPPLVMSAVFSAIPKQPMPFFIRLIVKEISKKVHQSFIWPQLKSHFEFLNSHLQKNEWFAGSEFSAADIQISYAVLAAEDRMRDHFHYPKLKEFVEKIKKREAFKVAIEKGGPLELSGG
jgi:glutathione S-transferase